MCKNDPGRWIKSLVDWFLLVIIFSFGIVKIPMSELVNPVCSDNFLIRNLFQLYPYNSTEGRGKRWAEIVIAKRDN